MSRTGTRRGSRLSPHPPIVDPAMGRDDHGDQWCACGLPVRNERHRLNVTPVDLAAAEARRYGDREDNA